MEVGPQRIGYKQGKKENKCKKRVWYSGVIFLFVEWVCVMYMCKVVTDEYLRLGRRPLNSFPEPMCLPKIPPCIRVSRVVQQRIEVMCEKKLKGTKGVL